MKKIVTIIIALIISISSFTVLEDSFINRDENKFNNENLKEDLTADNDISLIEKIDKSNENIKEKEIKKINYEDAGSIYVLVNKKHSLNPSNYKPKNLVKPNIPFVSYMSDEVKYLEKVAAEAIENLVNNAKKEGIEIWGRSGFRSFKTQHILFDNYVKKNGYDNAIKKSALPGHSEHQTGLAIDVTSPSVNFLLTQYYGKTKEGIWLKENAHKYGFIIRYPENKENITGYIYEPWHLRYVGKEVATEIFEKGLTFEEYLDVVD